MNPDFGGYVTKYGVLCADGRRIESNAFSHQDGDRVPLVWGHRRDDPENILGYGILEHRDDGVYVRGYFNNSEKAILAKNAVQHGDITHMSIYANRLSETPGRAVKHGFIREVSLVVTGANPGAMIDNISVEHGDGSYGVLEDEAVIYTDTPLSLEHEDKKETEVKSEEKTEKKEEFKEEEKTVQEVIDGMTEEQKAALYAVVDMALEKGSEEPEVEHSDEGGNEDMGTKHNIFESTDKKSEGATLTHEDLEGVILSAKKHGSLRDALTETALEHGIDNLDVLFPEAKAVSPTPDMITRDQEWVAKIWNAIRKSPFSRIRSFSADLTKDEARAKGYIKGKKKQEEQFALLKRITTPQTIYKKQSLDRDDIVDITDFNVVAWLKAEMRMMLNEEIVRAVLIGDGRPVGAEDKINEANVRPIVNDADMYTIHYEVDTSTLTTDDAKADAIITGANRARKNYKGSGSPTMYIGSDNLTTLLLAKDKNGRRLYATMAELASANRVKEIVEVPVLDEFTRKDANGKIHDVYAIIVNPIDYSVGADRGGAVSMFDDFDIDYNKEKYLIETRLSGALTKPYSAIVLEGKGTNPPTLPAPSEPEDEEING